MLLVCKKGKKKIKKEEKGAHPHVAVCARTYISHLKAAVKNSITFSFHVSFRIKMIQMLNTYYFSSSATHLLVIQVHV